MKKKSSIRRSLLYVPGDSERKIEKALTVEADSIILDLEDAVIPEDKEMARNMVKKYIQMFKDSNLEIMVRINDLYTRDGILDLECVIPETPNAVIIPKADEKVMKIADTLLYSIEVRNGNPREEVELIPLLETSKSILDVNEILNASKRITGVQFGAEDFTKEMEIERTILGKEIEYPRNIIAIAGNAKKIDILDTPYVKFKDPEGLLDDTRNAISLGFTGKTCIHPSQVRTVNTLFTPYLKDVERAKKLLKAFDISKEKGDGVCVFEGEMIDNPVAERARKLVEKWNLINNVSRKE